MKHWKEGQTYQCMPEASISLAVGGDIEQGERVLAIGIRPEGQVDIAEQCDGWFGVVVPPAVAIELFEEAIAWIRQTAEKKPTDTPPQ